MSTRWKYENPTQIQVLRFIQLLLEFTRSLKSMGRDKGAGPGSKKLPPRDDFRKILSSTSGAAKAGKENLHLVTYHIPTKMYIDHGPIFLESGRAPSGVNSIAIIDKQVFALAVIPTTDTGERVDLIGFDLD